MKVLDYFFSNYKCYRNLFNCNWKEYEEFCCDEHDMSNKGWYEKRFKCITQ